MDSGELPGKKPDDLITPGLQRQGGVPTFHYALKRPVSLVLGASEKRVGYERGPVELVDRAAENLFQKGRGAIPAGRSPAIAAQDLQSETSAGGHGERAGPVVAGRFSQKEATYIAGRYGARRECW